ncbi:hypothetical protein EDB89DRAFT_1912722 [Lactarius sanguifluus]|nr:hypothetical protein EDB89DRAFT_1912722 [Lactarius sanguifluus]
MFVWQYSRGPPASVDNANDLKGSNVNLTPSTTAVLVLSDLANKTPRQSSSQTRPKNKASYQPPQLDSPGQPRGSDGVSPQPPTMPRHTHQQRRTNAAATRSSPRSHTDDTCGHDGPEQTTQGVWQAVKWRRQTTTVATTSLWPQSNRIPTRNHNCLTDVTTRVHQWLARVVYELPPCIDLHVTHNRPPLDPVAEARAEYTLRDYGYQYEDAWTQN